MATKPHISVVIPTFREVTNIPLVAQDVAAALGERIFEIIFVDDNSNDGSLAAVAELKATLPVHILVRKNIRGLSTAVIAGIEKAKSTYIVVMDADLSHPATAILSMIERLESSKSDFVIGSRYVAGGTFDENWGTFRLLNSKLATWLAMP